MPKHTIQKINRIVHAIAKLRDETPKDQVHYKSIINNFNWAVTYLKMVVKDLQDTN